MFEIQGYAFMWKSEEEMIKIKFKDDLYVDNWAEAHELMKKNNVDHYLIVLKEVR